VGLTEAEWSQNGGKVEKDGIAPKRFQGVASTSFFQSTLPLSLNSRDEVETIEIETRTIRICQ
jgi:hypothetical protein